MCGIVFKISSDSTSSDFVEWEELVSINAQRGPHSQRETQFFKQNIALRFFSAVLHLRGDHVAVQPHQVGGNVLCWNGEIFEGIEVVTTENDGVKLFDQLCEPDASIPEVFSKIEGPYAFVFYQHVTSTVFFGRDPLGRRSLVVRKDETSLTLASVSSGQPGFTEIPADSLFSIRLDDARQAALIPVTPLSREPMSGICHLTSPRRLRRELPSGDAPLPTDPLSDEWRFNVTEYLKHLNASVALRTRDIPRLSSDSENSARVAVLFSGGVDSAVVAFLANKHIPLSEPIDLLNVAFENPRTMEGNQQNSKRQRPKQTTESKNITDHERYQVPDRITGQQQLEEFRRLEPARTWNFVEINVPYEESKCYRPLIEKLMYPSNTVMDLSLAQALYFASRGKGIIRSSQNDEAPEVYTSTARVILSGLGADELLGGYVRHKNAFRHAGWIGLLDELQLDTDRIHTRNLGRDDRVISTHGKEARYPFLSMNLLAYLSSVPTHMKTDPRLVARQETAEEASTSQESLVVQGLSGDKLLHRLAARQLGLWQAAGRAKRAMQFGSRSARQEKGVGKKEMTGGMLL